MMVSNLASHHWLEKLGYVVARSEEPLGGGQAIWIDWNGGALIGGLILEGWIRWVFYNNGSGGLKPIPILTTRSTSLANWQLRRIEFYGLRNGRRAHAFVFIGGHGRHDRP